MEVARKAIIIAVVVAVTFLAMTLRTWDRREPFKKEVKRTLIFVLVFGAIAAAFIYFNN